MKQVHSVGLTVSDLEQAKHFYTQVLPFEWVSETEVWGAPYEQLTGVFGAHLRVARLRLGEQELQLTEFLTPPNGRLIPRDSRSNDLWFQHIAIVVSDMERAYHLLREYRVQHVSTSPQTLPPYIEAAAGIKAFYFRDPDGHNLELIQFPVGKGDPQWQRDDALFLGIDHTAIAVSSTLHSLEFYQSQLGFQLAGSSENYGNEQEHLNMVFGAHLQITGLRALSGIGVEFLEYLTPTDGRPIPTDTRCNDLWYWETTLVSEDIERDVERLRTFVPAISVTVVELPDASVYGFTRAFILRDPDRHALKIVQ